MSPELKELISLMPVPDSVPDQRVNWELLESVAAICYPPSFKEFIETYGLLTWFGEWTPLCCAAKDEADVKEFLEHIEWLLERCQWLSEVEGEGKYNVYPEKGGLFPFLVSIDGHEVYWVTKGKPETWSAIWFARTSIRPMGKMSITRIFLDWMKGSKKMEKLWGDFEEFRQRNPNKGVK